MRAVQLVGGGGRVGVLKGGDVTPQVDGQVFGQLENILNMEWNEAQFDTESRLFDETKSVSELHYTTGNPFNVQVVLAYEF
mgnify:CR=1 FL=1